MKKIAIFVLTMLACLAASATDKDKSPQKAYIEEYAPFAVSEMYRSGVPASITLAQGLLESGNGQSELARKSNNHFGIKCHNNWDGERVYHDDDAKGECFRKYAHPYQSYRDHSDFLRYRDRYKFLFDYKITDYKSWAHGLKAAGYATDPLYPTKLIRLIEEYELHKYDSKALASGGKVTKPKKSSSGFAVIPFIGESLPEDEVEQMLPLSPTVVEQAIEMSSKQREEFSFSLSRNMYTQNAVPFVYAVAGDTYASIAASYDLFDSEILKFNDLKKDARLLPGDIVYLKPKKKSAAKGVDKYVMEEGESLWEVSQRYGVKLSSIIKLNGFEKDYVPREGDIILLRKQ